MKQMKNIFILFLSSVLLLFSACGKGAEPAPYQPKNTAEIVATINGETVTREETDYFQSRCRADVINEFSVKYQITDFTDFWDKDFDGVTPNEVLRQRALDCALRAKVSLILMRKVDIYQSISFADLKEKAEDYNKSHSGSGSVGLSSVDLESFYSYYIDTGEMELKNRLAQGELKPTQGEIDSYLAHHSGVTQEGAISALVNISYEKYLDKLVKNAEITVIDY